MRLRRRATIGRFVIGDRGLPRALPGRARVPRAGPPRRPGRSTSSARPASGVRACIYYPDAMIRRLERHPPQRGLDEDNVDAFADAGRGARPPARARRARARRARRVSLLELELHANVSKHLVLSRFLAGRRRARHERRGVAATTTCSTRRTLLRRATPRCASATRTPSRWALRFLDAARADLPVTRRVDALRELPRARRCREARADRAPFELAADAPSARGPARARVLRWPDAGRVPARRPAQALAASSKSVSAFWICVSPSTRIRLSSLWPHFTRAIWERSRSRDRVSRSASNASAVVLELARGRGTPGTR